MSDAGTPLSDGQYRGIGKVVASFNTLEALVRLFVTTFISENNDVARVLTSRDAFAALLNKFKMLVPLRIADPTLQRDLLR